MNKHIQVRNLDPALHRKIKMRAAERDLTITDYVKQLLEREVSKPSMKEWLELVRRQTPVSLSQSAAEIIRRERDNR
jgi:plasmid stability protein